MFFWRSRLASVADRFSLAPPPPKTITREWEEASNQRALEMKLNPITGMYSPFVPRGLISFYLTGVCVFLSLGISSEGYSGKGFVQTK